MLKRSKIFLLLIIQILLFQACNSQDKASPGCINPAFDQRIKDRLDLSVPIISVTELNLIKNKVHIFDTRKPGEFEVSHLPGAKYLGYDDFDLSRLDGISKMDTIVLYCSIGFRSEKIAEKLQKSGYQKVFNLYGSIFEWANHDLPLVDSKDKPTLKVHTYNRRWGKWMENKKIEKVYN